MGLGSYPAVSLVSARERASANRIAVAGGRDPRSDKRRQTLPTFRELAERYIEANAPRWRNPKTAINWHGSLQTYAYPVFGDLRIDRITAIRRAVGSIPYGQQSHRLLGSCGSAYGLCWPYAQAHGHIELNVAGEIINAALPAMPSVKEHFRALPYQELGQALRTVETSGASLPSRLCLRFLVLTAARSGEARGATWSEVDIEAATWTVPGSRMKAGREHRVPLSKQALNILKQAYRLDDGSWDFVSRRP